MGKTAHTDKSYPGDNRLIAPNSSHRRRGLAPRCRLITSWRGSTFQGFGCSPIKVVRELGSERRETVRFISGMIVRNFAIELYKIGMGLISGYGAYWCMNAGKNNLEQSFFQGLAACFQVNEEKQNEN